MYRSFVRTQAVAAIAFAWTVAISSLDVHARAAEEGGSSDGATPQVVWSTVDALWNARDAKRFSELFTMDTSFGFVDRGWSLDGRAAVRRYFEERFPTFAPDLRHLTDVRDVRVIAPEVRTVDGKVEILRKGTGDGVEPAVLKTFEIFAVMTRNNGAWKIHVLRAYELPTADDAAVP